MEFGPAGRQVGTLASSRSAGPFDSAGLHVAGIEDGTARGPPVFRVWGGAWGAVGRRGHMAAGAACRYLFRTAWSEES